MTIDMQVSELDRALPLLSRAGSVVIAAVDRTAALVGLILLAPVMLGIALMIRRGSPGSALFRQERLGRDGRRFTVLKFRTMRTDAGEETHRRYVQTLIAGQGERISDGRQALYKLAIDDRVTRIGARLRRTSLDELPQLWNVVRGDMSLAGPRPVIAYEAERYPAWYHERFTVKHQARAYRPVAGQRTQPVLLPGDGRARHPDSPPAGNRDVLLDPGPNGPRGAQGPRRGLGRTHPFFPIRTGCPPPLVGTNRSQPQLRDSGELMIRTTAGIAMVGFGYWGPNIVRNILQCPDFKLRGLCELDPDRAAEFERRYPGYPVCSDFEEILLDPRIDAVAIATPPNTHFHLARRALLAGKHVLVEKPLATDVDDAVELVDLAERIGLTIMPGHTFVYSPPVNKVRDLIQSGDIGDVYFITSSRMNLGLYQQDGVILDLAPHDLSILLYWLDRPIVSVAATGRSIFQRGVPETAFLTFGFEGGTRANVQISWLAPRKLRQMTVVGSKRMVQYEDTSADEAVRIYDRGLDISQAEAPATFGEYRMTYRSGDIVVPRIEAAEPLALELTDFARAIRTGEEPRSSARLGVEVVRALNAAQTSLHRNGEPVLLNGNTYDPDTEFGQWSLPGEDIAIAG